MRKKKVEDTAELRELLLETIDGVNEGSISSTKANTISSLAGKVIQSVRVDLSVFRFGCLNLPPVKLGKK